jgi:hypothetical protein
VDWTEVPVSADIKNIGTQKQLFLDDDVIETQRWVTPRADRSASLLVETGADAAAQAASADAHQQDTTCAIPGHVLVGTQHVYRTWHEPLKHADNPLVRRDRPWEGASDRIHRVFSPSILRDPETAQWRMWYTSLGGREGGSRNTSQGDLAKVGCYNLYATSEDGIHWEKPSLGRVAIDGSGRNNVIRFDPGTGYNLLMPPVIRDPADAEPGVWRYKCLVKTKPHFSVAVSNDGLDWRVVGTFPRLGDESADCLYDHQSGVYVQFTRNRYKTPAGHPGKGHYRTQRTFQIALSRDMINWSHPRLILTPEPRDGLDGEPIHIWPFQYAGLYLAVLGVRKSARLGGDVVDNELVFSRDLLHWQRLGEQRPFLSQGPEGSFDHVSAEGFCVVEMDDEIRFYYDGNSLHEDGMWEEIGLATLRRDGFVSLDAPPPGPYIPQESLLLTRPLWSTGSRLVVNARAAGYITAELATPDGSVLEHFGHAQCEPFTGDSLEHAFSWQGRRDIGGLFPLRIRFRMRDAQLFSLQVTDSQSAT